MVADWIEVVVVGPIKVLGTIEPHSSYNIVSFQILGGMRLKKMVLINCAIATDPIESIS